MKLMRIEAPHFCAGLLIRDTVVVHAAPILKYMTGWSQVRVQNYCTHKKWKFQIA